MTSDQLVKQLRGVLSGPLGLLLQKSREIGFEENSQSIFRARIVPLADDTLGEIIVTLHTDSSY